MVYLESWRSAQAESLRLRLEIQKMVEICEAQDRVLQDLRHNDEIAEEARRMVYDDYASLKENATNNRIEWLICMFYFISRLPTLNIDILNRELYNTSTLK